MAVDNVDGSVWTWGYGQNGRLGLGDEQPRVVPDHVVSVGGVGNLHNIIAVSAGWDHSMALEDFAPFDEMKKGRVYTWGKNTQSTHLAYYTLAGGRLGDGTTTDRFTPVIVKAGAQNPADPDSPLTGISVISAGESHCMALDYQGNVWTWGDNTFGQLGDGTNNPSLTPVKVVGFEGQGWLENIVAISAGYWHCIAIDSNGTIWTWGWSYVGRLGLGATSDRNTPTTIPVASNLTRQTGHFRIQGAIDESNNGDVIQIPPQTFFEHLTISGKEVTLTGTVPDNAAIVSNTVIDGWEYDTPIYINDNAVATICGLTVRAGSLHGIQCSNAKAAIDKCIIKDNVNDGVNSTQTELDVHRSVLQDNGQHGISIADSQFGTALNTAITGNVISGSSQRGISCTFFWPSEQGVTFTVANNLICSNGHAAYPGYSDGIWVGFAYPLPAIIRNNTIVNNIGYGVKSEAASYVDIDNCIVWGNTSGDLSGCTGTTSWIGGADPGFVDAASENHHLSSTSLCIDAGSGNYPDETDIDGERRMFDGNASAGAQVDIGADEYYDSPADFDDNGIVNFIDYAPLAYAWMTSNGTVNLVGTTLIDVEDLMRFAEDWLWEPAWTQGMESMLFGRGGEGEGMMASLPMVMEAAAVESYAQPAPLDPNTAGEVLDWLDKMWLTGELDKNLTEETYLDFREALKEWTE